MLAIGIAIVCVLTRSPFPRTRLNASDNPVGIRRRDTRRLAGGISPALTLLCLGAVDTNLRFGKCFAGKES